MATPIPDNEASFDADELSAAVGPRVRGEGRAVRGVVLDSRRVGPGNVFVALRGEQHDAHRFVESAVASGAAAVIVDREIGPLDVDVYRVPDTLAALGALGALHRARSRAEVIAVTGSVGKTTTKELIAAALRGMGRTVLATAGNLNNRIGVPMTLLSITDAHDAAVIEIGMSIPGEIADLARMTAPHVGVVTAVAEVHTEGVGGLAGVAREKGALLDALPEDGVAIHPERAPLLQPYVDASTARRKLRFGVDPGSDVRAEDITVDEAGTRFTLALGERRFGARLALLGEAAAIDAAAALAAVSELEGPLDAAIAAMSEVPRVAQRMCTIAVEGGVLLVDDTYNASPSSMAAALRTAAGLAKARGGRAIAVLGDMLELGDAEVRAHEALGRQVVELGAAALLAHGARMAHAVKAATRAQSGTLSTKIRLLADIDAIAGSVRELAQAGDVVLVKGSRGMRMERVVAALGGPSA